MIREESEKENTEGSNGLLEIRSKNDELLLLQEVQKRRYYIRLGEGSDMIYRYLAQAFGMEEYRNDLFN